MAQRLAVTEPMPAEPRSSHTSFLRYAPAVMAIVVPVVLAIGASHYLVARTVDRFHSVMDRAVASLAPVTALRGNLTATVLPVHGHLLARPGGDPGDTEGHARMAQAVDRVERGLSEVEALTALQALDPGPVAAVRREWEAARAAASDILDGPPGGTPGSAATLAAFDTHLSGATAHLDTVFSDALYRLSREWRVGGDGNAEHLAVMGIAALLAVVLALGAGGLALRARGEVAGSENRFATLARHDPLTGIENRQELHRRVEEELARSRRFQRPVSVVILGLDHLGEVNQTYGDQAGDVTLVAVAGMIANNVRAIDRVARYGGEAFAAVLPETDLGGASVLGERLRRHIDDHPVRLGDGTLVPMTVSVGVAAYPTHAGHADQLLRAADAALGMARELGRNRVEAARSDASAII